MGGVELIDYAMILINTSVSHMYIHMHRIKKIKDIVWSPVLRAGAGSKEMVN